MDHAPSTAVAPLLAGLLLAGLLLVGTAGAVGQDGLAQTEVDPDDVVMSAAVAVDGDADWTITYRVRLDDRSEIDAFEDLQRDVANDSTPYVERFSDRMARTVAGAENATGREMAIANVTVETDRQSLAREYGVLTYRFTWRGFARVDGSEIHAGDALDQLFLDGDTALRIAWPAEYGLVSATPALTEREERRAIWRGPIDFDPGEPRLVVSTDAGADGEPPAGDESLGILPVAALGAVVLVIALGAWAYVRRRDGSAASDSSEEGTASGVGTGDSDPDASGADEGDEAADAPNAGPPSELLSNEERVLQLLERNGGRMKQQAVASDLDWTAAKTSQVVGDLRDEDRIESFRLGRENVLTLPDVDLEPETDGDDS